MEKEKVFIKRLTELRMAKDLSAREMSLSLGQSAGYINNIENGVNLSSMLRFFDICDFLGISEQEFFDLDSTNPTKSRELASATKSFSNEQLDVLLKLVEQIKKRG